MGLEEPVDDAVILRPAASALHSMPRSVWPSSFVMVTLRIPTDLFCSIVASCTQCSKRLRSLQATSDRMEALGRGLPNTPLKAWLAVVMGISSSRVEKLASICRSRSIAESRWLLLAPLVPDTLPCDPCEASNGRPPLAPPAGSDSCGLALEKTLSSPSSLMPTMCECAPLK